MTSMMTLCQLIGCSECVTEKIGHVMLCRVVSWITLQRHDTTRLVANLTPTQQSACWDGVRLKSEKSQRQVGDKSVINVTEKSRRYRCNVIWDGEVTDFTPTCHGVSHCTSFIWVLRNAPVWRVIKIISRKVWKAARNLRFYVRQLCWST